MVYVVKSKTDFDQQLIDAGEKLVVVDFFADWCGPCKMIAPKLAELANEYADRIVVLTVDVDECEDVAMDHYINNMPTFVFFKNLKLIEQFIGADTQKLIDTIEKLA